MSFDVDLKAPDGGGQTVEVGNTTYNHSLAWEEALGHPFRELNGRRAGDAAAPLAEAANKIANDPAKYEPLIAGGGSWGTVKTAEEFLRKMSTLCERHFDCQIEIT